MKNVNSRCETENNNFLPGKLYVVEGCDGSGKSTQIYLLDKWLESEGYSVFFTEWNSSQLIRESTTEAKKKDLLTPTTFSLMHASDFADRYEKLILPQLRAGYIVLCDRYIYTAFARDMARGCDSEWVKMLTALPSGRILFFISKRHWRFLFGGYLWEDCILNITKLEWTWVLAVIR